MRLIVLLFFACFGLLAQEVLYPPIARQARVQGVVIVDVKVPSRPVIVSGPAMLRQAALDHAEKFSIPVGVSEAIYHFELRAQKKINPVLAGFLRVLNRPAPTSCRSSEVHIPTKKPKVKDATLHIWKYDAVACLNTVTG